jgi:mannose/cellobiose epimerase-like protein (N-acyl-D-glucosamine 2-epimerase family)
MKNLCFIFLTWFTLGCAFAADWPTGQWETNLNGQIVEIEINRVLKESISVTVEWADPTHINLKEAPFTFTDESKTFARAEKNENNTIYQVRITSFGSLIFEVLYPSEESKNELAFLKPVPSGIRSIEDYPTEQAINDLPSKVTWLNYAAKDLWKFWGSNNALEYSSYRCNDGSLVNPKQLCSELRQGWIIAGLDQEYTRMLSRQVYLYGVLFNMTGDTDALEYMEIGVDALIQRYEESGSAVTTQKNGNPLYQAEQRTSQDLAYVQVGLAMYYYLTGDVAILEKIDTLKDYVIAQYYREDWQMLAWTLEDQLPGDSQNQELVAQLDQLNAYMLLVYPHLPNDMKAEWEQDIRLMVDILVNKFHIEDRNRFAGQIIKGQFNDPGDRHNDFGHSVKTYWMIYTAGQMLNDKNYMDIGRWGIDSIIKQAIRFREEPMDASNWGNQVQSNNSSWWEFAELTQATATLMLEDSDYARYLPDIYSYWLNNFVDKNHGGVWSGAGGGSKQHLWKNGYHEAEIGLVALITTQKVKGEPFELFFKRDSGHYQPYLFNLEPVAKSSKDGVTKVTF